MHIVFPASPGFVACLKLVSSRFMLRVWSVLSSFIGTLQPCRPEYEPFISPTYSVLKFPHL